jgi:peptidoglycan/xylan/chitin deacetylase (PgdA/CDA1 family)
VYRIIARIVAQKKILLLLFFAAAVCFLAQRPEQSKAAGSADSVSGPKVIVLNYHKVDHMNHSLSVQPPDFEQQMAFLKDNGYHTITPHEMYMAFTDGAPLPSNPVLITFDDGYADNYTYAYPILKKYGMKAAIFVITSLMGKPGYLTWGQAAEMEASGVVSIESHTVNHGSLTELTDEQVRYELTEAKHDIEQRLGKEVEFLAYPTGAYNLHIASLVQEAGYKGAFTVRYGNMDRSANFYAIERVPIFHTSDTFASFLERLKFVPLFERIGWAKN